jgi:hypothetical protein
MFFEAYYGIGGIAMLQLVISIVRAEQLRGVFAPTLARAGQRRRPR